MPFMLKLNKKFVLGNSKKEKPSYSSCRIRESGIEFCIEKQIICRLEVRQAQLEKQSGTLT